LSLSGNWSEGKQKRSVGVRELSAPLGLRKILLVWRRMRVGGVPCNSEKLIFFQGSSVQLGGTLRATIYNFAAPKQSAVLFRKDISLTLISEIHRRYIPGSGPIASLTCRYPIEMMDSSVSLFAPPPSSLLPSLALNTTTRDLPPSDQARWAT
jgi:hypothetical protein